VFIIKVVRFYEIAPASRQYHGTAPLTYSSPEELKVGQVVVVKIRDKPVPGFVVKEVSEPDFKTNVIEDTTIPLLITDAHVELFNWMSDYYPGSAGITSHLFLPFSSPQDYVREPKEDNPPAAPKAPDIKLTKDQKSALTACSEPDNTIVLLHGDTGTGKTQVYIEKAKEVLKEGRSVLILVPEIALSPQIVNSFRSALKSPVHLTHSGLTPAKRRDTWLGIARSTEAQVVIGPRSALFTPLKSIGLVVMDEFHEPAYKQDQSPYYQTIRVAAKLARLSKAHLIMGSATPTVSEYYLAEQKNLPIIHMQEKASKTHQAEIRLNTKVVNLKEESEKTRYPLITSSLIEAIKETLARQEQVLLFLNKRGSARVILCQVCGWHAVCERCDLPLTFHGDTHRLQCHTCGYGRKAPSICPECSSHEIIFKSPGTKAIVESIQHLFPEAIVARFDKDNLKAERLETRHKEVADGSIDILVGTQMLAKGHDLPRLSLVGILLAENELQFPDYTSSERSFQLMYQLVGRVGRGHRHGNVVVQTYDPENEAVQTAIRSHSWQDFYNKQLAERRQFEFPPFFHMMKIEVSRARMDTVKKSCDQIIKFLADSGEPIKIVGPAPSFIEKRHNTWNWQIVVKAKQRTVLTRLAQNLPAKSSVDLDPTNLL
jgi:primosomal protein N' (replication factor Y) (superfamily II helicase)